jgi:lipid II:glycine glycyltransferase (peptidoglycan interpeptide bridge formation enzyme)
MKITIQNSLEEDRWTDFVKNHPDGNIFHTPEMFQVFNQTKGCRPQLWVAVNEERVLALLPVVHVTLLNKFPLRHFTTRSIAYGSILCVPGEEGEAALTELLQAYNREAKHASLFTEMRNLCDLEPHQATLQKHGFAYEDHLNYLINLSRPAEEILQSFSRRARKRIRHELREGKVIIKQVTGPEDVEICYRLLQQTYKAAKVPLTDRSLFEAAFAQLSPKKMIRFTLAYVEKAPVAVSVDLLFKGVMYGWFGGLDRAFGSYCPNELLTWHLIQWGAENGFHTMDFGGAGKPDEEYGVRDFKAKFGGDLVCYGRNICVHAPFSLSLSKLGYRVLKGLF